MKFFFQIELYFKCLPADKVPRIGTTGENYRAKQLHVQLPKQDLALAYCKHVESNHHSSYEDFINARNDIALDIAYAKVCTTKVVCFFFNISNGFFMHLQVYM